LSELHGATWIVRSLEEITLKVSENDVELRFSPVGTS